MKTSHRKGLTGPLALLLSAVLGVPVFASGTINPPPLRDGKVEPARSERRAPAAHSADGAYSVSVIRDSRLAHSKIELRRSRDHSILRFFRDCDPRELALSKEGALLASASEIDEAEILIKVWRVADGALLCRLHAALETPLLMRFSPDGRHLACAADTEIRVWNLGEGTLEWSARIRTPILDLRFSPSTSSLVAECADGRPRSFRAADGKRLPSKARNVENLLGNRGK